MEKGSITVDNFDYENIQDCVEKWTSKEQVNFALYCAELVVHLCDGKSKAPQHAINAVKNWMLDPSQENQDKVNKAGQAAWEWGFSSYNNDEKSASAAACASAWAARSVMRLIISANVSFAALQSNWSAVESGECVKQKIVDYILKGA